MAALWREYALADTEEGRSVAKKKDTPDSQVDQGVKDEPYKSPSLDRVCVAVWSLLATVALLAAALALARALLPLKTYTDTIKRCE
jgi:hypothetical protein